MPRKLQSEIDRKRLFYHYKRVKYDLCNVYIPNLRQIIDAKKHFLFDDVYFQFSCPISEAGDNIDCSVCKK